MLLKLSDTEKKMEIVFVNVAKFHLNCKEILGLGAL